MKKKKTPSEFLKKIPTEYSVILRDWRNAFPMLTPYTQRRLYVRSEIFMYGLTFMKLRFLTDEYRVYFECIPLWDEKKLINKFPIVEFPIPYEEKRYFDLHTYLHHCEFKPYKEFIVNKYGRIFNEDVKVSDFYNFIKDNILGRHIWVNEYFEFTQFMLVMAYFTNHEGQIETANSKADKLCKKIGDHWFLNNFKMTALQWKENFVKELESREFVEQARINAQNPKIAKVRQVHFVDDYEEYMAAHSGWNAIRDTLAKLFRRLK